MGRKFTALESLTSSVHKLELVYIGIPGIVTLREELW